MSPCYMKHPYLCFQPILRQAREGLPWAHNSVDSIVGPKPHQQGVRGLGRSQTHRCAWAGCSDVAPERAAGDMTH